MRAIFIASLIVCSCPAFANDKAYTPGHTRTESFRNPPPEVPRTNLGSQPVTTPNDRQKIVPPR
jgi:hypothetical protein